ASAAGFRACEVLFAPHAHRALRGARPERARVHDRGAHPAARQVDAAFGTKMQLIELAACPICGGAHRCLGSASTICPGSADRPELRSCVSCGHWWHSPVPDQASLFELYGSASRYVVGPDEAASRAAPRPQGTFDRFALGIIDRLERTRYLEIGAGGGQMMRSVQHLGFDCYGVDPGQWTSDPAIRRSLDDWPAELTFRVF